MSMNTSISSVGLLVQPRVSTRPRNLGHCEFSDLQRFEEFFFGEWECGLVYQVTIVCVGLYRPTFRPTGWAKTPGPLYTFLNI